MDRPILDYLAWSVPVEFRSNPIIFKDTTIWSLWQCYTLTQNSLQTPYFYPMIFRIINIGTFFIFHPRKFIWRKLNEEESLSQKTEKLNCWKFFNFEKWQGHQTIMKEDETVSWAQMSSKSVSFLIKRLINRSSDLPFVFLKR